MNILLIIELLVWWYVGKICSFPQQCWYCQILILYQRNTTYGDEDNSCKVRIVLCRINSSRRKITNKPLVRRSNKSVSSRFAQHIECKRPPLKPFSFHFLALYYSLVQLPSKMSLLRFSKLPHSSHKLAEDSMGLTRITAREVN